MPNDVITLALQVNVAAIYIMQVKSTTENSINKGKVEDQGLIDYRNNHTQVDILFHT